MLHNCDVLSYIYKICQLIKLINTNCRSLSQADVNLLVIPENGKIKTRRNLQKQETHIPKRSLLFFGVQELIAGELALS